MNLPSIFISYNSNSDFEETLALRLHTLGAVHGFTMRLPDRYSVPMTISQETMARINLSDYYILFSTSNKLTKEAEEEIQYAYKRLNDKSKIIIIYDAAQGKNIKGAESCTELFYDRNEETPDEFMSKVMNLVKAKNHSSTLDKKEKEALAGLVIAGVGLLFLGAMLSKN